MATVALAGLVLALLFDLLVPFAIATAGGIGIGWVVAGHREVA